MTATTDLRAVSYTGDRSLLVGPAEAAPPAAGQVRVEVAYTGICGTDLHIYHGAMDGRVKPPGVIGHEMSGRVAELGDGVSQWQVGDPVTVMPLDRCGACPACIAGHSHICHRLNFLGIDSAGSMQNSWTVPADTLVRLPANLGLDHAALIEPVAVAVHDVRRTTLRAGEKTVVVGGGPVGLLIAAVARHIGADVRLIEPNRYRRSVAQSAGLVTLDPGGEDVAAEIDQWTGGAGAAVAFEVSGAAAGVATAVDSLAMRGRLVLVAIHPTPREVNLHRFFWRELTLIGARLYERDDFEIATRLIADGQIPVAALISRIEPLERAADAFAALESGANVMKILIDCRAHATADTDQAGAR